MRAPLRPLVTVVLMGSLLLAACGQIVDVDRRALVIGVGLDVPGGGVPGYAVAIQYPAPSGQGGGGGGGGLLGGQSGGGMQPKTIVTAGVNVGAAVDKLRREQDRVVYLGNVGVITIGQGLARQDVIGPLDYFIRQGEVAETVQIAVASGSAATLLGTKAPEGVALPMFEYLRIAERVQEPTAPNPMWRFLAMIESVAHASYAPIMEPSSQGQPFSAIGTALFRDGREVDELDGQASLVLDWLIKSAGFPNAVVSLAGAAGPVTLRVATVRRRWRVLSPEHVLLTLGFSTTLREGAGVILDDHDATGWQQAAARQLQTQVRQVLNVLQKDGTDVLGLADRVHARYPDATADWPTAFSRMQVDLRVTVAINEGGRKT